MFTNYKSKHWDGPDRRFRRPPPRGGRTEGVVRGRTPLPLGDKWDISATCKSKNRKTAGFIVTGVRQKSRTAPVFIDVEIVIRE